MAFPSGKDIELPLLKEIADAGGEVLIRDGQIYVRLARYFPELTEEDLVLRNRSRDTIWENRVQWARLHLVQEGELMDWRVAGRQGLWKITEKGMARLEREKAEVDRLTKIASQTRQAVDTILPEDPVAEQATHARVQQQLEEMGKILGKYARQEFRQDMYRYDVVWKDADYLPRATHCFEVQHKGNLVEALAKLKHAFDIWGSKLILVITDERDKIKASQLLRPYFTGVFHEIGTSTTVLTADEVDDLHQSLSRHQDVINIFIGRR